MPYTTRTIVLIGIGAALVAGLSYVSFRTDPVAVDLAAVSRGPLEVTINADGQTQVRDLFEVASPIAGTALRSPVAEGDVVRKGETVVAIVRPSSAVLLDARAQLQAEPCKRQWPPAMWRRPILSRPKRLNALRKRSLTEHSHWSKAGLHP